LIRCHAGNRPGEKKQQHSNRMPLNCTILNPLHQPEWDELLAETPGASFFHTSAWARVLHETYGYTPVYIADISSNRVHFLLPVMEVSSFLTGRRGVALPFCDTCEPVVPAGADILDALPCLLEYGKHRKWQSLSMKQGAPPREGHTPWQRYVLHTLTLTPDIERLSAAFKSSTKRNINKALKLSVAITTGTSREDLDAYYQLHCLTRKRHGIPPQPIAFFRNIHKHVLEKNLGLTILARHNGTPVAGAVFFRFRDRSYYKYGAYDLRYQHLRAFNLVMFSAIRYYAEQGCTSFCFGRTEPDNEGLLQFKNGWNADVVDLFYYKFSFKKNAFEAEQTGATSLKFDYTSVLKKMPVGCLKILGNVLYRHIG
jgi:hypothetical protein